MNELEAIKLEGREFIIIDEIIINDVKYVYLGSAEDYDHFCIRKINIKNGKEILVGLDSDEEFDIALSAFAKKKIED